MRERPIIFSGEMVRAILQGRKQQTRRIVKGIDECPHGYDGVVTGTVPQESDRLGKHCFNLASGESAYIRCPYGAPGDRLWVRETFRPVHSGDPSRGAFHRADAPFDHTKWKPAIHMPRWACRIVLEVTKVRVERLFTLSEEDARREGMLRVPFRQHVRGEAKHGWTSDEGQPVSTTARRAFEDLWHSINGHWIDCWVWVVEFRRVE